MPRRESQLDVLVLGAHPSAYLAATLLRHKSRYRVAHSLLPGERPLDRPVLVNPAFFQLHPLLEKLKRKIESRPVYGLRFLADNPAVAAESRRKAPLGFVAELADIRTRLRDLARAAEVELLTPGSFQVHRADEKGIEITIDHRAIHPKALVLAGSLPQPPQRILNIPEEWERGVLRRYTFARIRNGRLFEPDSRAIIPMSLDLKNLLCWGWLLPGVRSSLLAVEQASQSVRQVPPDELLNHWADVLHAHGTLREPVRFGPAQVESVDLPFAGALTQEGLANRCLLIGPAAGFYTASAEDIYPNCWSAVYAAEVLKKALKEEHLQDALQPYRQRWRTTLGDYLRGPQQNLRFLLPLVYRNQVMTNRLADAILTGKSVVR